jgi:hypothetical protein
MVDPLYNKYNPCISYTHFGQKNDLPTFDVIIPKHETYFMISVRAPKVWHPFLLPCMQAMSLIMNEIHAQSGVYLGGGRGIK